MISTKQQRLSRLLRALTNQLDIPPSTYREARRRYRAVGEWLGASESILAPYNPFIHPQGSFAYGTVVRPLGDDDFDIDSVCLLRRAPVGIDQKKLKSLVGDRLSESGSPYREMIEPKDGGRRCWTIQYADDSKFHLDILRAIPDDYEWLVALGVPEVLARHAIRITDKQTWDLAMEWPRSNPKGFEIWFRHQMEVRFAAVRAAMALDRKAEIEEIEDYEVRTPLQLSIQLLKRHRDVRYNGDSDKPISIIITTLAAKSYDNEADLSEAILNIVPRMREKIEMRRGVWWIENPVNKKENFADKWKDHPRKATIFFEWLDAVEREHRELLVDPSPKKVEEHFVSHYGGRDAKAALQEFGREDGMFGAAPAIIVPAKKISNPSRPQVDLPSRPSKPWGE